jgi:hypothetical protein
LIDINKALEVNKALIVLADLLSMEPMEVAKMVCFFDDEKVKIMQESLELSNKFYNADMFKRGEMLGIKLTKVKEA